MSGEFLMEREQSLSQVRQLGWLAHLPDGLCTDLLSRAQLRPRAVGDRLYMEDAHPGGLFGLASGSLSVTATLGPFQPRLIHVARPGWWVGEASMVSRTRTRVEVTARQPSVILVITAAALADLSRHAPEIWRYLALLTVSHMDNALNFAGCILARGVEDRVIATLLRLAEPLPPAGETISLPITKGELAELAGLSRNPVGPVLRDLERSGDIKCHRGSIDIHDLARLAERIEHGA